METWNLGIGITLFFQDSTCAGEEENDRTEAAI